MYHKGSLLDFNTWHDPIKNILGLPSGDEKTIGYSSVIEHPNDSNDVIWHYGNYMDINKTSYSLEEVKALGFFPNDPMFDILS